MAVEMRSYQMKTTISIISHFENFKIIPDLQNCSPDQNREFKQYIPKNILLTKK